jgi:hypothetical protein
MKRWIIVLATLFLAGAASADVGHSAYTPECDHVGPAIVWEKGDPRFDCELAQLAETYERQDRKARREAQKEQERRDGMSVWEKAYEGLEGLGRKN